MSVVCPLTAPEVPVTCRTVIGMELVESPVVRGFEMNVCPLDFVVTEFSPINRAVVKVEPGPVPLTLGTGSQVETGVPPLILVTI